MLELDEVASHPQVVARALIASARTGTETRPAVAVRSDWRRRDPPALGEHTAEVLSEVGVDGRRLDQLKKDGAV